VLTVGLSAAGGGGGGIVLVPDSATTALRIRSRVLGVPTDHLTLDTATSTLTVPRLR
jgi:hypothetical protein